MNHFTANKSKASERIATIAVRVVLLAISCTVVFPILWNLTTSFKTNTEIMTSPWSFPKVLQFENYIRAFTKARMADYFLNSVFVVALSMALLLILVVPAAYSLTRLNLKRLSKIITNIYIACLFLQVNVLLVSIFILMSKLNMVDSRVGLSIVMVATNIPFNTFFLAGFMKTISKEYEYAAMIDGCSHFSILTKIIVPLSAPAITTVSILSFFSFFNEYILTLVVISSDSKKTLPVGLANLYEVQRYATDWGALFAALIIMLAPVLVVYLFGQKSLTRGMGVGGLKG